MTGIADQVCHIAPAGHKTHPPSYFRRIATVSCQNTHNPALARPLIQFSKRPHCPLMQYTHRTYMSQSFCLGAKRGALARQPRLQSNDVHRTLSLYPSHKRTQKVTSTGHQHCQSSSSSSSSSTTRASSSSSSSSSSKHCNMYVSVLNVTSPNTHTDYGPIHKGPFEGMSCKVWI